MIILIDFGSVKTPQIEKAVDETMDCLVISADEFVYDENPSCLGYILSGAPKLITEIDMLPYLNKFSFLKTLEKPILGICFGHQLIGLLHGAFGSKMKEDRDWQEIEFLKEDPLFSAIPTITEMMEDHCETISIPTHFELLGTSDACVNEAMRHSNKPIYGVQFHPEVSGNMGFRLIENFVKICQKDKSHPGV